MTGFVRRFFGGGGAPVDVPDGRSIVDPEARARDAWRILHDTSMVRRGGRQLLVMDGPGRQSGVAAVWPMSQVVAAALDLARLDIDGSHGDAAVVDDLGATLERYRWGDGYAPYPGGQERYFDDNAWVGLDFMQAHGQLEGRPVDSLWLHKAKRTFGVVVAGQDDDGGVRWKEGPVGQPGSRNTCSTAPAIELALRLHAVTGTERYGHVAERADAWLWRELASPAGLLWDHVDAGGTVERTVWSYNQGAAIGADVLWWRLTGDGARLDRATATAASALDHFATGDLWWRQPPAFNAIFFRNLLSLHAAQPQPRGLAELDRYLERVWREARDPVSGRFTGGGIGHYDDGGSLDHAALVQLFALQAFPVEWLPEVS